MFSTFIDNSKLSTKTHLITFLIISLMVLINFSNIVNGQFVADDLSYIVNNPSIKSLFNTEIFFPKQHLSGNFANYNAFRPIYTFVLALLNSLFGLNPFAYHIANILLHTINSFLIYILTYHYTNKKLLGIYTALIFAVHPIHTEAVSNITGLSELLTTFFLLIAIWSYSKSKNLNIYYFISLICYLLGIMSKENGVVLIGVIILLDICSNWDNLSKLKTRVLYYFGFFLTLISYLVFKLSLRGAITNRQTIVFNGPITDRIYTMSLAFIKYFFLLLWPKELNAFYDTTSVPIVTQLTVKVFLALLLIGGLLITGVILLRYNKLLAFSILFFFGSMSVVSNIFFDIGVIMAERFLYFPSISICLIVAWAIEKLQNGQNWRKTLAIGLLFLILTTATVRTCIRNLDWLTPDDVMIAFIQTSPKSPRAANMKEEKAVQLFFAGQTKEAIELIKEAIDQSPNFAKAHYNLGIMLCKLNNFSESIVYLRKASALTPKDLDIRLAYATTLLTTQAFLEAKSELENIIKTFPESPEAHNYLGTAYANLRLYQEAKQEFEISLKLNPNYKLAQANLLKLNQILNTSKSD